MNNLTPRYEAIGFNRSNTATFFCSVFETSKPIANIGLKAVYILELK